MSNKIINTKTIAKREQINRAVKPGQYLQSTLQKVADRKGEMSIGEKRCLNRVQKDAIVKEKRIAKVMKKVRKELKLDHSGHSGLKLMCDRKNIKERKVLAVCRTGGAINQHMNISA